MKASSKKSIVRLRRLRKRIGTVATYVLVIATSALVIAIVGRVGVAFGVFNISYALLLDVAICVALAIGGICLLKIRDRLRADGEKDDMLPVIIALPILVVAIFAVMFSNGIADIFKEWLHEDKKPVLEFLGWGISGVIAIYGFTVLNRRATAQDEANKLTEKGHDQDRRKAEDEKLAKKQAHDQDRFRTAVEHLTNEQTSGRIASFYEFFYLARDVPDYAQNILGILCAHLRHISNPNYLGDSVEEIKTLLINVLFSRKAEDVFGGLNYDLQRVNLPKFDFRKMHNPKANVDFNNADLSDSFFTNVNLSDFNLQEANLRWAKMQNADLRGADLQNADLQSARLIWADLRGASLQLANLQEAKLRGANLQKVNLQNANLKNAYLRYADLRGADLQNAINLETAKLADAKYNDATDFPDEFEIPEDMIDTLPDDDDDE